MNINVKKPIRLDRASAWRTYSGGSLIEKLYGNEGAPAESIREKYCIKPRGEKIIGYSDTEIFALEKIEVDGERVIESDGVFSGIYVLEGEGRLGDDRLVPGSQYFIPAASEPFTARGNLKLIRFYGPRA